MSTIYPKDLISDSGISLDEWGYGEYNNCPVRFNSETGVLEIGEDFSTFDRWAISDLTEFDLCLPSGQRAFKRWLKEDEEGKKKYRTIIHEDYEKEKPLPDKKGFIKYKGIRKS